MKNQTLINSTISTIGFELELSDKRVRFNTKNPATVQRFINNIQEEFADELATNLDAKQAVEQLQSLLDEHNAQTVNVSKDDLKEVYLMLKERKLHPVGEFDKRGAFTLKMMNWLMFARLRQPTLIPKCPQDALVNLSKQWLKNTKCSQKMNCLPCLLAKTN